MKVMETQPQKVMANKICQHLSWILIVLMSVVLLMLLFNIAILWVCDIRKIEVLARPSSIQVFSEEKWRADINSRYEMIDDLLNSKTLEDITEELLVKKLGASSYTISPSSNNNAKLVYLLGSQSKYPSSSFFLPVLKLANLDIWIFVVEVKDGQVINTYISTT